MESVNKRLLELSQLPDGWLDGVGITPTPKALEVARDIMEGLYETSLQVTKQDRPGIFPMEEGGVSIEWAFVGRKLIAIEINPEGLVDVYKVVVEGKEYPHQITENNEIFTEEAVNTVKTWLLDTSE